MPNWCLADHRFIGKQEEIQDMYDKLKSLEKMEKPLVKNDFGKLWLGCIIVLFGGDRETIYCRGYITCFEKLSATEIQIQTETAWSELPDVWAFVTENYPGIEHYYYAEEPGCGYYVTNDRKGEYFPDRYVIDQFETGPYYVESELSLFEKVSEIVEQEINNREEMEVSVNAFNKENCDNEIMIIKINVI